ncbi:DUF4360 domain-containing protein [Streptomyces netropsis]|uniref:Secreted protein n=1 Tax=Streptomyces netropsis TaxID=55404 RepID=A0A7W7PGH0_STRNE|nr:DUF4360 domain-containing protein [Streptomyces netropsis]MBB4889069.1 hypothetical protein [Streptomyces netropsis]
MSRVLVTCSAIAALCTPALSTPASAAGFPAPPDKIVIEIATVNGSGCPAGTAAVAVSPDNTAFTVTYSQYLAQVGVGAKPTDFRKNCQLNLIVHVPQGFTYAIAQADYRGFGHLEAGATGQQKASYYFQGQSQTTTNIHPHKGPFHDSWQATDTTDIAAQVWAPCGERRNFNINTELTVSAGTSDPKKTTSFLAMDSTDGAINTVYRLSWKECPRK